MDTIRAFVAVPLTESVRRQLDRTRRRLENQVLAHSVRWVHADGIHLTLKFLGDTPAARIPDVEQALAAVARHVPPFRFAVGGLGCFPDSLRPRVIWVGVQEASGRLAALQAAVEEALLQLGYESERRGFTPHLTLGRVSQRASRSALMQIAEAIARTNIGSPDEVEGNHFALIRSVLQPTGAKYTTLADFPLSDR